MSMTTEQINPAPFAERLTELTGQPVTLAGVEVPRLAPGTRLAIELTDGSARIALHLEAGLAETLLAPGSAEALAELAACAASAVLGRPLGPAEVRVGGRQEGSAPPAKAEGTRAAFRATVGGIDGSLVIDFLPEPARPVAENRPAEVLLGLELPFAVTLGSVAMELRQIQSLEGGALVPLGKSADGPVSLVVGGRVVARGELVVVDGCFGIRVTSVETAERRLTTLVGY